MESSSQVNKIGINKMPFSLLLASNDSEMDNLMLMISEKLDVEYNHQPAVDASILTAIGNPIDMLIYDLSDAENHFDTISVINSLNPNLPIVVITDDNSMETMKNLAQLKIFYRVIKPVQMKEIESVLDAVQSMVR